MKGFEIVLMVVLVAGCQFCDRHVIDNPKRNQIIRVQSGDRFYFDLDENMTTGYSWGYACNDADVEVLLDHKGPPESKPGEPMLCGASGKASVRVRIHRGFDGPADVKFFYKRPWEKEPVEQFTISLYKRTGDAAFWK